MSSLNLHPAFHPGGDEGDLAVIACHFNPCGYQRPVENLRRFLDHLAGAPIFMTELAFDGEPFLLSASSPRVLQVRTTRTQTLWEKESLLTAAARRLPPQFTKVAWVDADILFSRADWISAASALLDNHPLIQLFGRAIYSDFAGWETRLKPSVGYAAGLRQPQRDDWQIFHPGFAWAARRELFSSELGGLYHCPVGGGDSILALAAMGKFSARHASIRDYSPALQTDAAGWSKRIAAWTKGRLTYLPGDVTHLWHGDRKNRAYAERKATIRELDPAADLRTDPQTGLTTWTASALSGKPEMVAAVRAYFAARQEDTVPV